MSYQTLWFVSALLLRTKLTKAKARYTKNIKYAQHRQHTKVTTPRTRILENPDSRSHGHIDVLAQQHFPPNE